jgi:hypothetical protein
VAQSRSDPASVVCSYLCDPPSMATSMETVRDLPLPAATLNPAFGCGAIIPMAFDVAMCFFLHVFSLRFFGCTHRCWCLLDAYGGFFVYRKTCTLAGSRDSVFNSRPKLLDFLGTWVAGGLGFGGLGLRVGLGPSPPSVHIALCFLCFLVSFSSSRQSTSCFQQKQPGRLHE